jgi:hypothetical protein
MNWKNLKLNKCPKCEKSISGYHFFPGNIVKHPCGFTISVRRFSEIVNSMVTQELEEKWNKELI